MDPTGVAHPLTGLLGGLVVGIIVLLIASVLQFGRSARLLVCGVSCGIVGALVGLSAAYLGDAFPPTFVVTPERSDTPYLGDPMHVADLPFHLALGQPYFSFPAIGLVVGTLIGTAIATWAVPPNRPVQNGV